MARKNGLYWLRSERSLTRSVTHVNAGLYYLMGEKEPVTEAEIEARGWHVGKRIKKWNKP